MDTNLILFIIFAVVLAGAAYFLNGKTNESFASKEYLEEGEKELHILKSVFTTQRFLLSWIIYPSADIFVTNKRIVIFANIEGAYYAPPTSIFYYEGDCEKTGGLVTSYVLSDIRTKDQKTIIKGNRLFMGFTWKIDNPELVKMVEEAKNISI